MRIVCLSDTHCLQNNFKVPDGDVLVHAGDFCRTGDEREVHKFAKWIHGLPHRWKVVVAGNHDWLFQKQPELARAYLEPDVIYLQDSGCEIEGLKFWGSPWQPWFMDWAFNLPRRGQKLRDVWDKIPLDIEVLITHSPPYGVLDRVRPSESGAGQNLGPSRPLGCEELANRLQAVRPKLHIFGHIHDGYGMLQLGETTYVNACICDESYRPIHPAITIDLNPSTNRR